MKLVRPAIELRAPGIRPRNGASLALKADEKAPPAGLPPPQHISTILVRKP